jgi:hypothetical protein
MSNETTLLDTTILDISNILNGYSGIPPNMTLRLDSVHLW